MRYNRVYSNCQHIEEGVKIIILPKVRESSKYGYEEQ